MVGYHFNSKTTLINVSLRNDRIFVHQLY